jgi:putative oxidoreductase
MELNFAIAVVTVRILTGILFFFQGYDKIFNIGMHDLRETISTGLNKKKLPESVVGFIAVYTSWVELIAGFLLIIGFFKLFAVSLLCLNLIIVSIGFSMSKPMWDNNLVFIRLVLLIFLLVVPQEWDIISFDHLFQLSKLRN